MVTRIEFKLNRVNYFCGLVEGESNSLRNFFKGNAAFLHWEKGFATSYLAEFSKKTSYLAEN
jgi:hypothetical protein